MVKKINHSIVTIVGMDIFTSVCVSECLADRRPTVILKDVQFKHLIS